MDYRNREEQEEVIQSLADTVQEVTGLSREESVQIVREEYARFLLHTTFDRNMKDYNFLSNLLN